MNVYDTANKLAKEIKESREYSVYKQLKQNIDVNPDKKTKVEEFEQLRYKTQLEQMQGMNPSEESTKLLQEKYAQLINDEEIRKYFEAETQFNILITDVNKIIAEAVKDVL